jgi:hypothetical protein
MARKLRLEYPGAVYHLSIVAVAAAMCLQGRKTKEAFEACLFQACEKAGEVLHTDAVCVINDTAAGRKACARFLGWRSTEGPAGKNKAPSLFCKPGGLRKVAMSFCFSLFIR